MPRHIDYFDVDTFRENPMEFWAVCTNVGTGKAEYKRLMEVDNNCLEYIRASASMPIAARIVTVEGKKLLDGGIADSIPLRFFQEQGYERNLVVLTQPEGFCERAKLTDAPYAYVVASSSTCCKSFGATPCHV